MRNQFVIGLLLFTMICCGCLFAKFSQNLFNGQDLNGWHVDVPEMDNNPAVKSPFIVREGLLVSLGTPGGHLITDAVYKNYRFEAEYRFAGKPGNCGVLVHASTPRALYKMFPKSLEVQMMHENAGDFWCIVEDIQVKNMVKRRGPKEEWGITEGKKRRIINLTDGSEKAIGKWNTMVIECLGREIKVWVNGDLVNHGYDCTTNQGQIAVQAEGSEVEFRTLRLTPISTLSDASPETRWIPLFDGLSLDGWIQKNGKATYRVEDHAVVGRTTKNSPNSFLCSAKDYGDFVLEFEVKLYNNALNSGVQIRSNTQPAEEGQNFGRVNGPQVEIEGSGSEGAEAGYVYGEACGGWMTSEENLIPHKAFLDGRWNQYRIVAEGPRIRTWINGKAIEDLEDEEKFKTHPEGFIGLQVHDVGDGGPFEVAWRNIRVQVLSDD